jgi:O-antigen ligase
MYLGVLLASLAVGLVVARSQATMTMSLLALLALAGIVVLLNLPTGTLFLGWLFLSPLFQVAADTNSLGRAMTWGLYIAPALVLVLLTLIRPARALELSALDWLPLGYVAYVAVSIVLTTNALREDPAGSAKAFVTLVALGPIVYYFLTRGPGAAIPVSRVLWTLAAAGVLQALLAVAETSTGWTLWGASGWLVEEEGWRATATLGNPAVLGALLGVCIVLAVAILTWGGPRRLRPVAWVLLVLCTPALLVTMTRGPIVATTLVVVLLLLLGQARLVGVAVLIASAVLLFALLPALQKSELYAERVSETRTVDIRVAIQDISLQLAAQKPVLGWGYGSFDQAKNAANFVAEGISAASVFQTTSHNTYLTVLVELGGLGWLLLMTPFLVVGYRAIKQRAAPANRWLLAASLGSLGVVFLTGSTLDFRFFSFALMLPFVFLAILRRLTAQPSVP